MFSWNHYNGKAANFLCSYPNSRGWSQLQWSCMCPHVLQRISSWWLLRWFCEGKDEISCPSDTTVFGYCTSIMSCIF